MRDRVVLETVVGATPYLEESLRSTASDALTIVERHRDALVVDIDAPESTLANSPYFTAAGLLLDEDRADWRERIGRSLSSGLLAGLDATRPIRFRVGSIGAERWEVRDWLRDELGWANEPSGWEVNVERTAAGLSLQVGRLFLTARFGELERLPASTTPVIAAVLCRLAKIEPGQAVLDPFCGAATNLLLAATLQPDARTLRGFDLSPDAVDAATANLAARGVEAIVERGDARQLPLPDGVIDRVVSNIPFGKRVGSHRDNETLYPRFLQEVARVLSPRGRAALLTEDKRLFKEAVQRTRGLRIVKEVVFETGGAHPSAYVLSPTRASQRQHRPAPPL